LLLGQVLRELQLVDAETLDQVITEQILQLQSALREANRQLERRVEERTRDLQRALERLTELNQLKANFIANISHELRTPLAHLKGYLDLLKENGFGALNEQQKGAVDILQRSELRLEKLIEDLISFFNSFPWGSYAKYYLYCPGHAGRAGSKGVQPKSADHPNCTAHRYRGRAASRLL